MRYNMDREFAKKAPKNRKMSAPQHYPVFVYGSLRTGELFHGIIGPYISRCTDAVLHGTQMYSLGEFPALIFDVKATPPVVGELMHIWTEWWEEVIERLDKLESEGFLYHRTLVSVITEKGDVELAWTYILNQENLPLHHLTKIVSNDWKKQGGEDAYKLRSNTFVKPVSTTRLPGAIVSQGTQLLGPKPYQHTFGLPH